MSLTADLMQFCLLLELTEEKVHIVRFTGCVKLHSHFWQIPAMFHKVELPSPCALPSTIQDCTLLQYIVEGETVDHYGLTLCFGALLKYSVGVPNLIDFVEDDFDCGWIKIARVDDLLVKTVFLYDGLIICMILFVLDFIFNFKMVQNNSIIS